MDDARAVRVVSPRGLSEQALYERPGAAAGSGMDDDAGRLVDDEQVLVLEGDAQRDVLAFERCRGGLRLELDRLSTREAVALRPRRAVDRGLPSVDQPLGGRPRPYLGQRREEPVEPGPRCVVRDAQADGQGDPPP